MLLERGEKIIFEEISEPSGDSEPLQGDQELSTTENRNVIIPERDGLGRS